jgi:hypothetical protein
MLTAIDQENLAKSNQSTQLLLQDLQALTGSANLLLGDIALELMKQVSQVEWRLNRIMLMTKNENQAA